MGKEVMLSSVVMITMKIWQIFPDDEVKTQDRLTGDEKKGDRECNEKISFSNLL